MAEGLSNNAVRLVHALRDADAFGPDRAVKDSRLAKVAGIPVRRVIDAAHELLAAGFWVVARCQDPPGRFIATDIRDVRAYLKSLRGRALCVLHRYSTVKRAIAQAEANPQRQTKQGSLFQET